MDFWLWFYLQADLAINFLQPGGTASFFRLNFLPSILFLPQDVALTLPSHKGPY